MAGPDGVILLHGILRSGGAMSKLERALRDAGYRTANIDYPSRRYDIATLASFVADRTGGFIAACAKRGGKVHVVTHSMGGLVARALLARETPGHLGRVVMLGPPNQGSEIADLLSGLALYGLVFGPAGRELETCAMAAPIDYEVGIIAGSRSLDPLGWAVLPKPNDGKVSVARTHLPGQADHITLPATHTFMMRNAAVIRATLAFLRDGRFDENGDGLELGSTRQQTLQSLHGEGLRSKRPEPGI